MASIDCPPSHPRSGLFEKRPSFEVDPSPNEYYAIELTTDSRLFTGEHRHERNPANFFGTWQDNAPLKSTSSFRLPEPVWDSLKKGAKIYYRLWTSADPLRWRDHATTVPANRASTAPFTRVFSVFHFPTETDLVPNYKARSEEVFETASQHQTVRRIIELDNAEIAIHPHPYRIGRFDPRFAEWIVIVTAGDSDAGTVRTVLLRLSFETLEPVKAYEFNDAQRAISSADAAALMARQAPFGDSISWFVREDQLTKIGSLLAFERSAGDFGGAQIVDSRTARLLYSASTVWNGRGKHLLP